MKQFIHDNLGFLQSPVFWQTILHAVVIGIGAWSAQHTNQLWPMIISSAANSLLGAPTDAVSDQKIPTGDMPIAHN